MNTKTIAGISIMFAALCIFLVFSNYFPKSSKYAGNGNKAEKQDGIMQTQQMEFDLTRDVSLGYIPKDRLVSAHQEILRQRRENGINRTTAFNWIERGPKSDI